MAGDTGSLNLHYENLPFSTGGEAPPAWRQLRLSVEALGGVRMYLREAKAAKERKTLKMGWKLTDRPPTTSRPIGPPNDLQLRRELRSLRSKPDERVWVELVEDEEQEDGKWIDDFLRADYLRDAAADHKTQISVLDSDPETASLLLDRTPSSNSLYLVPDTRTLRLQIHALETLQNNPLPHHLPLLKLFQDRERVGWDTPRSDSPARWFVLTDTRFEGVESQRRFVAMALGTRDFAFLEGPPGSGKTMSICELIAQEASQGHRVLLCASTHVAVDNVLEKLVECGLAETEVIPVRVGEARNVADPAKPFQLENLRKTERERLIKKLEEQRSRSEAQEILLSALRGDRGEELVERLILDCANLVCGTTLGIQRHPDIAGSSATSSQRSPSPLFDTLIVDEVSKTTFPEFLVPALWARKWVLVGDIRQLSPYVEEESVQANLAGLVDPTDARACRPFTEVANTPIVMVEPDPGQRENVIRHAEALGHAAVLLEEPPDKLDDESLVEVLGAHVIVADPQLIQAWNVYLPADALNTTGISLPLRERRRRALGKKGRWADPRGYDATSWEYEVAWRLERTYELRGSPEAAKPYEQAIGALIPRWLSQGKQLELQDKIDRVRQIAFPSVLETLRSGMGTKGTVPGSSLALGLDKDAFDNRSVSLEFQHRMHPEISKFPREEIYEGRLLKDSPKLLQTRTWEFPRYSTRVRWMNVEGKGFSRANENIDEADLIIGELEQFRKWSRSHPAPTGATENSWKAAVLTFYRPQEAILRGRLQRQFGQPSRRQRFEDKAAHLKVVLGTVDRFQGQEADIVFLSLVRTRGIGFLDNPNRLNVALTRARYQLVLIGNHRLFAEKIPSERGALLRKLARSIRPDLTWVDRSAS